MKLHFLTPQCFFLTLNSNKLFFGGSGGGGGILQVSKIDQYE